MDEAIININGTKYQVSFEYETPEPLVGHRGGYSIYEVVDDKTGEVIWTPTISYPPHLKDWEIIKELEIIRETSNEDIF